MREIIFIVRQVVKDFLPLILFAVAFTVIFFAADKPHEAKPSVITLPPIDVQPIRSYGRCASDTP